MTCILVADNTSTTNPNSTEHGWEPTKEKTATSPHPAKNFGASRLSPTLGHVMISNVSRSYKKRERRNCSCPLPYTAKFHSFSISIFTSRIV